MRKIILQLLLIGFFSSQMQAQIQLSLNVDSNPTPELSEWVNRNNLAIFTVTNTDPDWVVDYILKVELYKDGILMLETNNNVVSQTLEMGTVTFLADEIIPYSAINFTNNSFQQSILQTGLLPAGLYSFCVSMLKSDDYAVIATDTPNPACQPMVFTAYQTPELIMPINDMAISSLLTPTINFMWSPVTPAPDPSHFPIEYRLLVSEILSNQNSPSQAFHVNTGLIDEDGLTTTQFIWPSDIEAPDNLTNYVWSVQTMNTNNNLPVFQPNNGFAAIQTFQITPANNVNVVDCECDVSSLTQPSIAIVQADSINNPRKLKLTNIPQLKNYLINCNTAFSANPSDYTIDMSINWDASHDDEAVPDGTAIVAHEYNATSHEIPDEICINYTIYPVSTGISGAQCENELCITTPQEFLDLNFSNTPTAIVAVGDTIQAGYNHEFKVIVSQVAVDSTNNKITGKGNVYVNWLGARVAVAFNEITLDTNKNLLTGKILGETYPAPAPVFPQEWGEEIIANNNTANNTANNLANWGNDTVEDVINWANSTSGKVVDWVNSTAGTSINSPTIAPQAPIPTGPLTDNTTPVKFPLGVNFPNGDQLAITEMVFRPTKSEFNLIAAINTPPSFQPLGEPAQLIGFLAKNTEFHPNNVDSPPERLELVEDVNIGNMNNTTTFTFISPANSPNGCYIEWDDDGFSNFGIELQSSFTRDWLIPSPDDGTRSTANFVATVQNWDDLVMTGNFQKSEIVDTQSMIIFAGNISLDFSDTLNPTNLQSASDFPSNYAGDKTMLFRGFHMEELTVQMPDCWQTNANGVPTLAIYDMIINDTGVTLIAEATNVAAFRGANVADLIASIDTVHVDIRSSSFHDAYVKGKIGLPISKADSIQNPLKYHALFTTATQPPKFQLTIEPTGPIKASLLKGVMELDPTSNIVASVSKNPNYSPGNSNSKKYKKTFQSTLNGNFVWDDVQLGPVKHVNMNLGFQGIEMNYNNVQPNNKFNFNAGTWSFASPQKFLSNFPVTIENIGFTQKSTTGSQLLHGDLNFDVIFNLSANIGGQTKLAIEIAIEENTGGSGLGKFNPKYLSTGIDDISIFAHLPAVSIDGTLQFRNDHPVFGNGFKGELEAAFKTPNIGISALAEFGNTNYLNNGATYRYWRIEAAAKFQPGIPFLPGIAFYGFGGGAFKNMEGSLVENPTDPATPPYYSFEPKKGNLGFQVEATIGAAAKVDSFNADVGLNGQFSSSDGLINIGFTGDFYIGGPLTPQSDREKAQIKGSVLADYNFPDKHFFMNVEASINTDKIKTIPGQPVNLNVDIDGSNNRWHFKFGEPDALNTVSIFNFELYEYLMFGNNISAPSGFTNTFKSGWAGVFDGDQPGIPVTSGVNNNAVLGKGFAFGTGFKFDKDLNFHIWNGYNAVIDVAAGAELNLSMMQKTGTNCDNPSKQFGLNGWRANGSIGFYGAVAAGVRKGSQYWPLMDIRAGGWLEGKFVNPTYVAGEIRGQALVGHFTTWIHFLGDCKKGCGAYHVKHSRQWTPCKHKQHHYLLNKSFQKDFDWGASCLNDAGYSEPDDTSSNTTFTQEDAAGDQAQKLIKYIHPTPTNFIYNFPVTQPISIMFGLNPDEVFDIAEQQALGDVLTRTFKLERTVNLFIDNADDGVYTNISASLSSGRKLTKHTNVLGEELYVESSNMMNGIAQMHAGPISTPSGPNGANTMSTMQLAANANFAGSFSNSQLLSSQNQGQTKLRFPTSGGSSTSNGTTGSGATGPATYDDLPDSTPPVLNDLSINKNYKIIVTATLKEYLNEQWVNAQKRDGSNVSETETKFFRTGPRPAIKHNRAEEKRETTGNVSNAKEPSNTKKTFRSKRGNAKNKTILRKNKILKGVKTDDKETSQKPAYKSNFKRN